MIKRVELSKQSRKDLRSVPSYIVDKLDSWVDAVERDGVEEIRKLLGYHDEPLHGQRQGQRSIRLSRSYRAIYIIRAGGKVEFVSVEEVTKHEY